MFMLLFEIVKQQTSFLCLESHGQINSHPLNVTLQVLEIFKAPIVVVLMSNYNGCFTNMSIRTGFYTAQNQYKPQKPSRMHHVVYVK